MKRNATIFGSNKTLASCIPVLALLPGGCTTPPDKPSAMDTLPACGSLPNCINTDSGRGIQAGEPLSANAEQWQFLKAWIARQDDWEIVVDDERFLQAVVKTPVMGFRDDILLLFLPDRQLVHVRSSSRLGVSDMGANARRVKTLRELVTP